MPVDKFGRMSDTKTKDTGVSLTYINNNYVRSDGGTPISGSLDMRGNTIYNVADPVNPQDVATKEYADNVEGKHLIAIHSSYTGPLIKNKYQFTFGGNETKNAYAGFLIPHSGRIKKIKMKTSITKNVFEDVVFKKDRADVDFIGSGFFAFTNYSYIEQLKESYTLIIGSILCYDAYKLYVKGNPDAGGYSLKEDFVGLDFCFEDDLPINPGYNSLKEGDIINVSTMIDLDLTKYGFDDPNVNTYHVTILIELDPL